MSRSRDNVRGSTVEHTGESFTGIAAAAGVLGKALGLFGRIRLPFVAKRKGRSTERKARWTRRGAGQESALELEIGRLEQELDRVYSHVVRGAGAVRSDSTGARASELPELIGQARDLKEQLQLKRAELSRIKREATRKARLRPARAAAGSPENASDTGRAAHAARPSSGLSAKQRRAIAKAARLPSTANHPQRVMFEKALEDLLSDDPDIRRAAAARMAQLTVPAVAGVLAAALDDPDDSVRAAALNSLALGGHPTPANFFERFAANPDQNIRLAALRGLSRAPGDEASRLLMARLEDPLPVVRKAAATYLGWRQERISVKPLIRSLYDDDEAVRAAAAATLGNIRDDRAVLSLIRTLADPSQSVRQQALVAAEMIAGERIEFDTDTQGETLTQRIEELKAWWRSSRVDLQLEDRERPPPRREPVMAVPSPAPVEATAQENVVELKRAAEEPVEKTVESTVPATEKEPIEETPAAVETPEQPEAAPAAVEAGLGDLDTAIGPDVGLDTSVGVDAGLDTSIGADAGLDGLDSSIGPDVGLDTSIGVDAGLDGLDTSIGVDAGLDGLDTSIGPDMGIDTSIGPDMGLDTSIGPDVGLGVDAGESEVDAKIKEATATEDEGGGLGDFEPVIGGDLPLAGDDADKEKK